MYLKLLIDNADPCELKALSSDTHLTVHTKQLWLLLICVWEACTDR